MATIAKQPKSSRFDMRMTPDQRREVEQAAAIKGKSLTQWALDCLLESARRDIQDETTPRLSRESFQAFVEALDRPMPEEAVLLLQKRPVWQ